MLAHLVHMLNTTELFTSLNCSVWIYLTAVTKEIHLQRQQSSREIKLMAWVLLKDTVPWRDIVNGVSKGGFTEGWEGMGQRTETAQMSISWWNDTQNVFSCTMTYSSRDQIYDLQKPSPFCGLSSHFLYGILWFTSFEAWWNPNFPICFLIACALGVRAKKLLLNWRLWRFTCMFSLWLLHLGPWSILN